MSANPGNGRQKELRNRRFTVIGLIILLAIYAGSMIVVQNSGMRPGAPLSSALTALSITLILLMLFILGRNIIKLYVERRRQKPGSQFSTRVVVTYIGMALVPTVMLFVAASNLITSAVETWFSDETTQIVDQARDISRQAREDAELQLELLARSMADTITFGKMETRATWEFLRNSYIW